MFHSLIVGEKAYLKLKAIGILTFQDRAKVKFLRMYGSVRPFLVRVYYRLFFNIEVKK